MRRLRVRGLKNDDDKNECDISRTDATNIIVVITTMEANILRSNPGVIFSVFVDSRKNGHENAPFTKNRIFRTYFNLVLRVRGMSRSSMPTVNSSEASVKLFGKSKMRIDVDKMRNKLIKCR